MGGAENLTTKFNFWRGSDKIPTKELWQRRKSLINRKETPNYENIYCVVYIAAQVGYWKAEIKTRSRSEVKVQSKPIMPIIMIYRIRKKGI